MNKLEEILSAVAEGSLSPSAAAGELKRGEVRYLDSFAALDTGRRLRKGVPEIIYAAGKSPEQTTRICAAMLGISNGISGGASDGHSEERVIVSGASEATEAMLREALGNIPVRRLGRALVAGFGEPKPSGGRVAAMSAGTSDMPVLEEAIAVADEMGVEVKAFHDVGVAGIHRLAGPLAEIHAFDPDCLIVAAGMEGALPTVVSALVNVPTIGLPTSTGYGLGGDGTAAILGMLQTCSPGLSVVNVDNGVGAGATAALIANRAVKGRTSGRGTSK